MEVVTTITLAAFLGIPCTAATGLEAASGLTISAATKKSPSARRQETGQIACTLSGCQRIPPNCHPEPATTGMESPQVSILLCAVLPAIGEDKDA
jgi:hypothetical protein